MNFLDKKSQIDPPHLITSKNLLLSQKESRASIQNRRRNELSFPKKIWSNQIIKRSDAKTCRFYIKKEAADFHLINKILRRTNGKCQKVEIMHHYCDGNCLISEKGLRNLSQCFRGFAAIRIFQFKIDSSLSHKIATTGIWHLKKGLEKLSSLESLDLCFNSCDVNDESLKLLRKGFRVGLFLKDISLSFAHNDQITDLGVQELCRGLKSLTLLQNISLNFLDCELITNQGCMMIKNCLKNLKNLKKIYLQFFSCLKISLYAVEQITQALKSLTALQKINIFIHDYDYHFDTNRRESRLTLVQNVSRCFWQENPQVEFNSLREFFQLKISKMPNFSAEYVYTTYHSDLTPLYIDLKALLSLKNINLTFHYKCEMTDQKLKEIAGLLSGQSCLKSLRLDWYSFSKVTDKGIEELSKALVLMLEKIHIWCCGEGQVTDQGLESLGERLGKMVCLRDLRLNFCGIFQMSEQGVQRFVERLEKVESLQEVILLMNGSEKYLNLETRKIC